ncbi:hypothetical protein [Martelella sp. HB161492]|uniref:YciI family protein n=1 Tax=Martelella sp. HB161492 TaxID=2720726 RepID=UPI0015911F93|nr:hypothetical protein [Martelella sp. HB161492]
MFITFLTFAENRSRAADFIAAHNEWIARGFADGAFLCAGTLDGASGGAILAHGETREDHDRRIAADPFVIHGIVTAETHSIDPKRTSDALSFVRQTE